MAKALAEEASGTRQIDAAQQFQAQGLGQDGESDYPERAQREEPGPEP